jgi:hypothetical protein
MEPTTHLSGVCGVIGVGFHGIFQAAAHLRRSYFDITDFFGFPVLPNLPKPFPAKVGA